eukprot:137867-Rhodomonas_salina.1
MGGSPRACYAVPGTAVLYRAISLCACHAMSRTDTADNVRPQGGRNTSGWHVMRSCAGGLVGAYPSLVAP